VADIIVDGNTRVDYVPTIADAGLVVTVAELGAGTRLDTKMTADGLIGFEPDTADVDNTSLSSTFDTRLPGRASFQNTMLRLKKQTGTDTIYDTLLRDTNGYIVVRRSTDADTTYATTQKVEVYPVRFGEVRHLAPGANETEKYEVPCKITAEPKLRITIAA
jgi:hypothetical protein